MKLAYKLIEGNNKKSISVKENLKHYVTVVRPEALYPSNISLTTQNEEMKTIVRKINSKY